MVQSPNTGGVYGVAITLGVVSTIMITLRFRARRSLARQTKSVGWRSDDWLLFSVVLFLWGLAVILIYGAAVGTIGTHTMINPQTGGVVPTQRENQISEFGGLSQILAVIALGLLKAGVVMFYRRVFVRDLFRRLSLIVLCLIAAWTVAFFFATVFQCNGHNLDLFWKNLRTWKEECYKYKTIQLAHAATDVATDLIVLSLPLHEIWKLHLKLRQKITVSLIFLIGLLSTAAGTARLVIVAEDIYETTAGARDVRGVETNVLVWTFIEVGVGIVAACIPTLGPLAGHYRRDTAIASLRSWVPVHSSVASSIHDQKTTGRGVEMIPIPDRTST